MIVAVVTLMIIEKINITTINNHINNNNNYDNHTITMTANELNGRS